MADGEAPTAQVLDRQLARQPGREADHGVHRLVACAGKGDRSAHREAEQRDAARALRDGDFERGGGVLNAPVELLPGADAVAHLVEADARELGGEPLDEPLQAGAPGAGHGAALATVDADHGERLAGVRGARLGAGGQGVRSSREGGQTQQRHAPAPRAAR